MSSSNSTEEASPRPRFDRESLLAPITIEMIDDRELNEDEQIILGIHREWLRSNRIADIAWCRQDMSEDVILCNTNGSIYRGIEHWCALWRYYRHCIRGDGRTGGQPPLMTSSDVVVRVVGDVGWISYRYRFLGAWQADQPNPWASGDELPVGGRGTEVYERRDGRWQLVHGHFSKGEPGADVNGL